MQNWQFVILYWVSQPHLQTPDLIGHFSTEGRSHHSSIFRQPPPHEVAGDARRGFRPNMLLSLHPLLRNCLQSPLPSLKQAQRHSFAGRTCKKYTTSNSQTTHSCGTHHFIGILQLSFYMISMAELQYILFSLSFFFSPSRKTTYSSTFSGC